MIYLIYGYTYLDLVTIFDANIFFSSIYLQKAEAVGLTSIHLVHAVRAL
jgi:hypothetical protein